jgi:hypothetical protein
MGLGTKKDCSEFTLNRGPGSTFGKISPCMDDDNDDSNAPATTVIKPDRNGASLHDLEGIGCGMAPSLNMKRMLRRSPVPRLVEETLTQ